MTTRHVRRAPLMAGLARSDITVFDPSMALLGWGVPANRPERVAEPLHARALVLREGDAGPAFALVVVDLCFVSGSITDAVMQRLRERHASLGLHERTMIVATHTHAGPNGFSDHLYFAVSAPGFSEQTRDIIVSGIVDALVQAHGALAPAKATYSSAEIPLVDAAVFNRSWFAYSSNPEAHTVTRERRDEAVDRRVRVLALRDPDSNAVRGVVSWFPLHATSIHSDVRVVHSDHKGLAACDLERQLGNGAVALFAQESAGDVTPNYRYDARRGFEIGRYDDDRDSAQHAADAQRRAVLRALDAPASEIEGPLRIAKATLDLSCAKIDPSLVGGREDVRTHPAMLGVAMAEGTAEGPGPLRPFAPLRRAVVRAMRKMKRTPRFPALVELAKGREGRVLGAMTLDGPLMRKLASDHASFLVGALDRYEGSFVPQRVPLQIARVGSIAIAGMPCEPTTIAGRRLRRTVKDALAGAGAQVDDVIVGAYADEYVGYCTTREEHAHQHYEAACTFFGPHTLDAYRTAHAELARSLARA